MKTKKEWIEVSEQEFAEFTKQLPSCYHGICEPPMISYDDFSLGNWPESMVARTWDNWLPGDPKRYQIRKDKMEALK